MNDAGEPGLWRGRPPRVWVLAVMLVLGSLVGLGVMASPVGVVRLEVVLLASVPGVVLTALIWVPHPQSQTVRIHVAIVLKMSATYLLVTTAVTGEGAMTAVVPTMWMGLYLAMFHPRWLMRTYVAAASVGVYVSLAVNPVVLRPLAAGLALLVSTVAASEVLSHVLGRAARMAVTDHLTGVANRQGLYQRFEQHAAQAVRQRVPLALVLIDLDGLKGVNDRYGHHAGDAMLVTLTRHLTGRIRRQDELYRIGGDEFLLVLPATLREGAEHLLSELLRDCPVPFSYGIDQVLPGQGLNACLARADARMYAHKQARRTASAGQTSGGDPVAQHGPADLFGLDLGSGEVVAELVDVVEFVAEDEDDVVLRALDTRRPGPLGPVVDAVLGQHAGRDDLRQLQGDQVPGPTGDRRRVRHP
ncbi:hypothetical protein BH23ACT9_BH23ACT9_33470 [soil metagenome]